MPKIIGVRFRNTGKVYYFDPGDFTIHYHDHVVVETARGVEYGTVVITPTDMPEGKIAGPLKKVIRMATKEDDERDEANREREKEAYHVCKQRIAERGLDMKLIGAEYTFDNSKVLFYFTADGRIDFRELVKDLAGIFRTRIELRQIGVRDETKLLGGIGSCGRPLCCHTWLSEFAPVSIKMARSMPGKGDLVTTPDGLQGDVVSVNILRQTVKVIVETGDDEKELREFEVKDITFIPKSKRPKKEQQGQPKNKGEKPDKSERPDRSEKPDKSLRPDKGEKPDRSEKPDKGEKTDWSEKPDRSEKTDKGVKAASESKDKASGGREKEAPKSKETEGADKKEKSAAEGEKKKRRRRRPRHKTQKAEETAERPAKQDAPQG